MERELVKIVGTAVARLFLQAMGAAYGRTVLPDLRLDVGANPRLVARLLEQLVPSIGWGRLRVVSANAQLEGDLTVTIEESVFAEKDGLPCTFLAGVIAGAVEVAFEQPVTVLEKRCVSSGALACEFHVSRSC